MSLNIKLSSYSNKIISAAPGQNQQSDCVNSEDSDQPGHPPVLIRVFARRSMGSFFMRTANTQIRLGECTGSFESSLDVQVNFCQFLSQKLPLSYDHRVLTLTECEWFLYESCHKFFMKATKILYAFCFAQHRVGESNSCVRTF